MSTEKSNKNQKSIQYHERIQLEAIVIGKNGAKQQLHEAAVKVKQTSKNLERRITDTHFALNDQTRKKKEKEFTKKKNQLIKKVEKLKNSSGGKSKQTTTSYIKLVVINLTDT